MINSTTSATRALPGDVIGQAGQATPKAITLRPDHLSTDSAAHLRATLAAQPEIRPEVVERAKALAADKNYPSTDTLRQVGTMILNTPDLSEDQS